MKNGTYGRGQIVNHMSAKRRAQRTEKRYKTEKGHRASLGDDSAIQRQVDFGFIRTTIPGRENNGKVGRKRSPCVENAAGYLTSKGGRRTYRMEASRDI